MQPPVPLLLSSSGSPWSWRPRGCPVTEAGAQDEFASAGLALATRPLGGALLPVSRPPEVVVEECQDGQANLGRVSSSRASCSLMVAAPSLTFAPRLELRVPGSVGDNAPAPSRRRPGRCCPNFHPAPTGPPRRSTSSADPVHVRQRGVPRVEEGYDVHVFRQHGGRHSLAPHPRPHTNPPRLLPSKLLRPAPASLALSHLHHIRRSLISPPPSFPPFCLPRAPSQQTAATSCSLGSLPPRVHGVSRRCPKSSVAVTSGIPLASLWRGRDLCPSGLLRSPFGGVRRSASLASRKNTAHTFSEQGIQLAK